MGAVPEGVLERVRPSWCSNHHVYTRHAFYQVGRIQNFYSAAFLGEGRTAVGARSGHIYIFEKNTLVQVLTSAYLIF